MNYLMSIVNTLEYKNVVTKIDIEEVKQANRTKINDDVINI